MARELRRLLIAPDRLAARSNSDGRVTLKPEEAHYLSRVLRLRPGDSVAVVDGHGGLWQARRGEGAWLEALQACGMPEAAPSPRLTLALALPRQEVELVWRMATELGVDRLQPLLAERCQELKRRQPTERWGAIVREATEQCERLWLPALEPAAPAGAWLGQRHGGRRLLATTRHGGLRTLEQVLAEPGLEAGTPTEICLAIGPEGGWSPAEEAAATTAGWEPISLGATILRSATAAVAGVSRLVAWRQLSC